MKSSSRQSLKPILLWNLSQLLLVSPDQDNGSCGTCQILYKALNTCWNVSSLWSSLVTLCYNFCRHLNYYLLHGVSTYQNVSSVGATYPCPLLLSSSSLTYLSSIANSSKNTKWKTFRDVFLWLINQSSIAYLSLNILNLALKLKIYLRYSQKQNVSSLFSGDASMNHIQSKRNTIIDRAAILYSIQCKGFCDTFGWLLLSTGQPKAVLVVVSQT